MATTRTLPMSGLTLTKPALADTADISVISTDMENLYQECVKVKDEFDYRNVPSKTFSTVGMTINEFIAECETMMGNGTKRGLQFLGYVNANVTASWGLDTGYNGYVLGLVHSTSYKKIIIVATGNNVQLAGLTKVGGTWDTVFYQMRQNVPYTGQIYNASSYGYGWISSSATRLYCVYPLPFVIPSGYKPVLLEGSRFDVRGISGYVGEFINNNTVELINNANYTTNTYKINAGACMCIDITKASGNFGITNNTPLSILSSPLKFRVDKE